MAPNLEPRPLGKIKEPKSAPTTTPQGPRALSTSFSTGEEPSRLRSILGAPIKGALRTGRKFAEEIESLPFIKGIAEGLEGTPARASKEQFEDVLQTALPTQEAFTESALERAGEMLPFAAIGGAPGAVGRVASTLGAGLAGQAVEEAGGGPLAQTAAEMLAFGAPSLSKAIRAPRGLEEAVSFAKSSGLTDSQIAPLIQSPLKQRIFASIAQKGASSARRLKEAYEGLGTMFSSLENSPGSQKSLTPESFNSFLAEMKPLLEKMPSQLRGQVMQEFSDLAKSGFTGKNLINFYQDLNFLFKTGNRQAASLQGPVKKAISSIDPSLAANFENVNQLYKNYLSLSRKMKPTLFSNLFKMGEKGTAIYGILTGNPSLFAKGTATLGGQRLATEFLLNPRFQGLASKAIDALNKNRIQTAIRLIDKIKDIKEED